MAYNDGHRGQVLEGKHDSHRPKEEPKDQKEDHISYRRVANEIRTETIWGGYRELNPD